jgi:CBS domain-containing protein
MNVEDVCHRKSPTCLGDTTVAEAGRLMREGDVRTLPVLNDAGKVLGLVEERDLLHLVILSGRPADVLPIRAAVHPLLHSCRKTDSLRDALRTMRTQGMELLPVVDGAGLLEGILSFDDLAFAAKTEGAAGPTDVTDEDVVLAMKMMRKERPRDNPRVSEYHPVIWI